MAEASFDNLLLRDFTEADIVAARRISAAVGWPHRHEDWLFAQRLGHGLVAERDGAVIGTALAWRYGDAAASLGMVTVAPDHQRRGLGRLLMQRILETLSGRRVFLHASAAGVPLYRTLGFRTAGAVRQYEGTAFWDGLAALPPAERLRPLSRSDLDAVTALDAKALGAPRQSIVAALIDEARGVVLDRGGDAIGFAMLRRFGRGHVIGPVVAPDAVRARALIGHWLGAQQGLFIRIDVPDHAGLNAWLEELGFASAGDVQVMIRESAAPQAACTETRRFALLSQALG